MSQPVNYQRLEANSGENLDRNLEKQFMHDGQAEMFDPNGFSFNGGHIERLKDKRLAALSAQNPTRKALNYRMKRNESFFDSRSSMLDSVRKERNRRVKVESNACGELKIEKKDAIFSEHRVDDFESTIDELTQSEQRAEKFAYDTRYFYNSGLNGLSYTEDGKKVTVDGCVCSPWDRSGLDLHSARLSETKDKKSIFYAGRPDTDKRLELQGIDIFLNELETGHKKGFVKRDDGVIELHYIIDSLSTVTQGVGQIAALGDSLDEGKSLEWERAAIKKARKNSKPIQVVHDGKTYHVLLRPTHVHNSVSFFASYNFLEFSVEDQINRNGYKKLVELYQSRLKKGLIKSEWRSVGKEIIDELGKHKDSTKIDAGMRIAMIDMLSKICDLPIVHHCKSVVDRTTGAAAVSIVNQMLLDGKFKLVDESFIKTIESDTELYKHLFVRALKSQLPVSSDVRSAVNIDGTLNTKRVLPGLEWHTGDTMVAFGFTSLMPKEALRKIPTWKKVGMFAVTCLAFIVTIFLSPVVRAVTWTFSGFKYCFKIPIILPTWLKPKYSFDHHSELLSEGGTRPVLNGPHNSDIEKKIKKNDPAVNFLLARKSELEAQPVKNQPSVDAIRAFTFRVTSEKWEGAYRDSSGVEYQKDYQRATGIYLNGKILSTNLLNGDISIEELKKNQTDRARTANAFRRISDENFKRMNDCLTLHGNHDPTQTRYLQDLVSQKYVSLPWEILWNLIEDRKDFKNKDYINVDSPLSKYLKTKNYIPTSSTNSSWKIDTNSEVVSFKGFFPIKDDDKIKCGFEVDVSFPFDHTKEFDIHFNFLSRQQLIYRERSIGNGIREDALKALAVAQSKSSRPSACRRRRSATIVSDSV